MSETITREQLFATLSNTLSKYDQGKVELVLLDLDLDPDGLEYPSDTLMKILKVFNTAQATAALQMQTDGQPKEEAIVLSDAVELTSRSLQKENIIIPLETLRFLTTGIVRESFEQADKLMALADEAMLVRINSRQKERTNRLLESLELQSVATEAILGEQARSKIIQSMNPSDEDEFDSDAFLAEVKTFVEEDKKETQSRRAARKAQSVDFNVDAFLKEVWG